jgi:hypothetical protein
VPPKIIEKKPSGYWKDTNNQKAFFDHLATKWNIQKPQDWHKVSHLMVMNEGGRFISTYYNNSLLQGKDRVYKRSNIHKHYRRSILQRNGNPTNAFTLPNVVLSHRLSSSTW